MAKSNTPTSSGPRTRTSKSTVVRVARKTSAAGSVEADLSASAKGYGGPAEAFREGGQVGRKKKPAARSRTPRLPQAVEGTVRAALDKKAEDVIVLDLRKAGGFTDYFVICTGANPRQITAIADGVRETLKRDFNERPALAEGIDRSEWILLDYFNFVVHIFSRDCRAFYGLERLWGNAERIEFDEEGGRKEEEGRR